MALCSLVSAPSSKAWVRMLIRSFCGSARRSAISSMAITANSPKDSAAASSCGESASTWPSPAIIVSDQPYIFRRCSAGRPMSSQMMMSGTWIAKFSTKSSGTPSPAAALASSSSMISLVSSRTWGIISRTRWGVKPLLIRRRWRTCSSPSRVMIDMSPAIFGRTPNRLQ